MINTLLFLIVYASGFIFTIIANPVYSFVLYETVYFFSPGQRWWSYNIPGISYSFYTVMLMFFAVIILYRKHHHKNKLLSAPQFKWIYLLVFLYNITYFYAVLPEGHFTAAINFLKLGVIISLAYKLIDSSRKLDYAIWGYIFGSWYISFLTWQTGRNSGDRVEGIGTVDSPDANGIAAAIAPSLVFCLFYFWTQKSKYSKLVFAFAGIFVANALVLINSRGAFLAAALGILFFMYYMYFSSFQQKFQKATALWISIIGLTGAIYLADESFTSRIMTIQHAEILEEEETGATRIIFWMTALDIARDYPFGSGYLGFDYYAPEYLPDIDTGFSRNRSVHSTWFEALTEIGYLGLVLLLLMIYSSYITTRKCLRRLKEDKDIENYFKIIALQAACFSYLIAMSFMNRFRAEILYWLILYTACAYNIYVLKSRGRKILT